MTTTQDTSHLVAIHQRLCRERARAAAATNDRERRYRTMTVRQAKREYENELPFLGRLGDAPERTMSDDEMLASLGM